MNNINIDTITLMLKSLLINSANNGKPTSISELDYLVQQLSRDKYRIDPIFGEVMECATKFEIIENPFEGVVGPRTLTSSFHGVPITSIRRYNLDEFCNHHAQHKITLVQDPDYTGLYRIANLTLKEEKNDDDDDDKEEEEDEQKDKEEQDKTSDNSKQIEYVITDAILKPYKEKFIVKPSSSVQVKKDTDISMYYTPR